MAKYTNFQLYDIVTGGDEEELLELKEVTLQGWVKIPSIKCQTQLKSCVRLAKTLTTIFEP